MFPWILETSLLSQYLVVLQPLCITPKSDQFSLIDYSLITANINAYGRPRDQSPCHHLIGYWRLVWIQQDRHMPHTTTQLESGSLYLNSLKTNEVRTSAIHASFELCHPLFESIIHVSMTMVGG